MSLIDNSHNKQELTVDRVNNSTVLQVGGDLNIGDLNINLQITRDSLPPDILKTLFNLMNQKSLELAQEQIPLISEGEINTNIPSEDLNALCNTLINKFFKDVKGNLDNGNNEEAEKLLDQVYLTQGFECLEAVHKAFICYYKGLVELEKGQIDEAQRFLMEIEKLKVDSFEKGYELQSKIATQLKNETLFNEAINKLIELGIDNIDIELKRAFFEIRKGSPENAIETLSENGEIKEQFEDNLNGLHYLGIAYFQENRFELAKKYLQQANKIKQSFHRDFILILIDIIPITNRPGALYLISAEEKEFISKKKKELLSLKEYFTKKPLNWQEEYWGFVLNINLFTNPSEIITDIKSFKEELQNCDTIQLMLAEALFLIRSEESPVQIYKRLYEKNRNSNILIKILTRLFEQNEYQEVIDIFKGLADSDIDEQGHIIGLYLQALIKVRGYDFLKLYLEKFEQIYKDYPLFYVTVAEILFNNGEQVVVEFLKKALIAIKTEHDPVRHLVAHVCESLSYRDLAVEALIPFYKYSSKARENLIMLLLAYENDDKDHIAVKIVNEAVEEGAIDLFLLNAKAELAIRKEAHKDALEALEASFKLNPTINTAYRILAIKIDTYNLENSKAYIDYLVASEKPKPLMLGAVGLDLLNFRAEAERTAYKALYLLADEFDETIYFQYIQLYMPMYRARENTIIEFEVIKEDTVIDLTDDSGANRLICLDSETGLVREQGEKSISCEHYSVVSTVGIKFIDQAVNSRVELDGIEYTIKSVTNKKVYAFRYCLEVYTTRKPDSNILQAIQISQDNPITPLIPVLETSRQRGDFIFQQYNSQIGLPISVLCNKDYTRYIDAIIHLLNKPEQIYFAGEFNIFHEESPIVLTLSSLILLKLFNKLNLLLMDKQNIYVPQSLIKKLESIFEYTRTFDSKVLGTMSLDEDGRPVYIPISDEEKKNRINLWREILLVCGQVNVVKDIEGLEIDFNITSLTDQFEIDSIFLSKQLNGVLICDDLFMRKVAKTIFPDVVTNNCVSILTRFIKDGEEYLETLLSLSKVKYSLLITQESLIYLIDSTVSKKPIILAEGSTYDKLEKLIKNILSNPLLFKEYLPVLRGVIYYLLRKPVVEPNNEVVIHLILKEIKNACYAFRLSTTLLLKFLKEPSRLDIGTAEFIEAIFTKY